MLVENIDTQISSHLSADSDSTAAVESDKRRDRRVSCEVVIMPCGTLASGKFRKARLVDCSANGIGILSTRSFPPGEQFLLKVRVKTVALLVYTVRYSRELEAGIYRIGAELAGCIGPQNTDPQTILNALLNGQLQEHTFSD